MHIAHGAVIGHGHAVKAHLLAQNLGQQMLGGRHRLAADAAIAGHHTPQVFLRDGRLEGQAVDLPQQPFGNTADRAMNAALRLMKPHIMLGNRFSPALAITLLLDTAGIGAAHGCCQRGILAVGFAFPAHARFPVDVQHGGQNLGDAQCALLSADDLADLFFQRGVKGSAAANPCREAGGVLHQRSAQTLHVEHGGNPETAVVHHCFLDFPLDARCFLQGQRLPEFQRADLSDTVSCVLLQIAMGVKMALKLGKLLIQRHLRQQFLRSFLRAQAGVAITVTHERPP